MNLTESAISSVRQDGIRLRFIFRIAGRDWDCISGDDGNTRSVLPAKIACDWLRQSHGQRIQTGSVLCDDGSRGIYRVRHYGVLHASRRTRPHIGGTASILDRRESGRASAARRKIAHARGLNMIAQKFFEQHGSGNKQVWDLAFEHGYEDGFKKTH